MKWLKNLKLNQKLYVLIILAAFFLITIGLTGFLFNNRSISAINSMYNDKLLPVKLLGQMSTNANANMANLLSMTLEEKISDKKPYYEDLQKRLADTKELLAAYESVNMDANEKAAAEDFRNSMTKYVESRTKVINLAMSGEERPAWETYQNQTSPLFNIYIKNLNKLIDLNVKQADEMYLQSKKDSATSTVMLLVITFSAFGLLITLGLLISSMITKPIEAAIGSLNEGASLVASASEQLSAASHQLAEGSSEQAASIQETSASIEESDSMVKQNTDNTQEAAALAKKTKDFAVRSNEKMDGMMSSMEVLKKSSDEIAKIIKVIDEIAFQTNILALNAAVEAARAGDAGKGFAVVAEEVRNLAQKCAQATKDTSGIIQKNVDLSTESAEATKEISADIKAINDQAQKVSDLLNEIAVASKEQAQGISQINMAISQMEQVVQANASTAEESASASSELSSQAINLKDVVNDLLVIVEGAEALQKKLRR